MDLKICWFSVCMTFLLLTLHSCTEDRGPFDTQYLPNGVNKSDYQHFAVKPSIVKSPLVHPPHWWSGMHFDTLQILIHDTKIKFADVELDTPYLTLLSIDTVENENYLFLNVKIDNKIPAGTYPIHLKPKQGKDRTYQFEIKDRNTDQEFVTPITSKDLIYLIFPDRFANGDQSNDSFSNLKQQGIDRSKMYFRHGGDIKGITNHLDYIQDLGFTAIWLNPVFTSDQAHSSYHGYASTNHYEIDSRFGGLVAYKDLSSTLQNRKMKLIMDIVPNHVGDQHWFVQDIPSEDWIHQFGRYQSSNHMHESTFDSTASEEKKQLFLQGWFDYSMPDLNQKNDLLAAYLIQNSIWWIEEVGLDGFRVDTYGYSYPDFMVQWANQIKREYPDFYIFGEVWTSSVEMQAKYLTPDVYGDGKDPKLDGITDLQVNYAIISALTESPSDSNGIAKLYDVLQLDSLYKNPQQNVIFLDNHDMDRFYSVVEEDLELFKSGFTILYALRGTICVYYGSETLHKNFKDPDGLVRSDFQGGWSEDKSNKFTSKGRSKKENESFEHIKKLNEIRKVYPELSSANYVQKILQSGIYLIERETKNGLAQLIFNQNSTSVDLDANKLSKAETLGYDLLENRYLKKSVKLKSKEAKLILWRKS